MLYLVNLKSGQWGTILISSRHFYLYRIHVLRCLQNIVPSCAVRNHPRNEGSSYHRRSKIPELSSTKYVFKNFLVPWKLEGTIQGLSRTSGLWTQYLGAERGFVVEVATSELAVLASSDDAVTLDADAARSTGNRTRHVPVLLIFRRYVLSFFTNLQHFHNAHATREPWEMFELLNYSQNTVDNP